MNATLQHMEWGAVCYMALTPVLMNGVQLTYAISHGELRVRIILTAVIVVPVAVQALVTVASKVGTMEALMLGESLVLIVNPMDCIHAITRSQNVRMD